jgi:hypothetical protein
MLKLHWIVTLSLCLPVGAFAQQNKQETLRAAVSSAMATSVCQSTFTSGTGPNFLQWCVTQNGNIVEFKSPAGIEHIREGGFNEGYGICDFNNLNRYFDWADGGDSGNWQAPVRTQPNGANTLPLKLVRNTIDGIFTLTQTFAQIPGEQVVKVTMTLKNNTAVSRDYALVRYADVDANNANGGNFVNTFDFDHKSAWGYNPGFNLYGLMLTTVPTTLGHFAVVQNTPDPIDPCSPVAHLPIPTPFVGDGSVALDWNGTLGPGKAVTVTGEYKRF